MQRHGQQERRLPEKTPRDLPGRGGRTSPGDVVGGCSRWRKTPAGEQRMEIVEKIFREAHSLKGAARAVNLAEIESVCHSLESVFAGLKSNRVAISPPLFDLVHQVLDALAGLLTSDAQAGKTGKPAVAALIQRLDDASKGAAPAPVEPPPAPAPQEGLPSSAPARPPASAGAVRHCRPTALVPGRSESTWRNSTR